MVLGWCWVGVGLVLGWCWVGAGLVLGWRWVGVGLVSGSCRVGCCGCCCCCCWYFGFSLFCYSYFWKLRVGDPWVYFDYLADNYALPHTTMRRIQLPAPRRIAVPQHTRIGCGACVCIMLSTTGGIPHWTTTTPTPTNTTAAVSATTHVDPHHLQSPISPVPRTHTRQPHGQKLIC